MNQRRTNAIKKILSANDTGETGAHQAGILIPKDPDILSFFPDLGENEKNPRVKLTFYDKEGRPWQFNFIYYNNKFFGGTRNEYRLTQMTRYIQMNRLKAGDAVILRRASEGILTISHERLSSKATYRKEGVLKLGSGWKVHSS